MTGRNILLLITLCATVMGSAGRGSAQEAAQSSAPTEIGEIEVLDLERAGRIALSDNPSLTAARERVRQAEERVRQARSKYWPRVDMTFGSSQVWLSDSDLESRRAAASLINSDASVSDPEDIFRSEISATWVLFDGFERKYRTAAARYGEDRSRFAEIEARRLLLSAVAASYFSAQLARENIVIAAADESFNKRQLKEARARRRVGTGSLSDVLNFEVRLNAATAEQIRAEQAGAAARSLLASLLGIETAELPPDLELEDLNRVEEDSLAAPDISALLDFAMDHRPEIKGLELSVNQAEAGEGAAKAAWYPALSASAGVAGERSVDPGFNDEDFGFRAGLELRYNIFSGGVRQARLREAAARKAEARSSLANARLKVSAEVREAMARLTSAQRQLVLLRSSMELVGRNRDLVEKEYSAGQASLVRLNEAQRDLIAAQGRLALSQASLRQAWIDIESVTGHLSHIPGRRSLEFPRFRRHLNAENSTYELSTK